MPAKTFIISKKANKESLKLPLKIHQKISQAFKVIKENPLAGPKLGGELGDSRKFRLGDYRIIYKFDKENSSVEVVKIEHRQGIYK